MNPDIGDWRLQCRIKKHETTYRDVGVGRSSWRKVVDSDGESDEELELPDIDLSLYMDDYGVVDADGLTRLNRDRQTKILSARVVRHAPLMQLYRQEQDEFLEQRRQKRARIQRELEQLRIQEEAAAFAKREAAKAYRAVNTALKRQQGRSKTIQDPDIPFYSDKGCSGGDDQS